MADKEQKPAKTLLRAIEFWVRTVSIYGSYKVTQARAKLMEIQGVSEDERKSKLWNAQHEWAGEQMYQLCISLRGFYLKAGQFIGSRADFVPKQICKKLSLLCDQVPPMAPSLAKSVLEKELRVAKLENVFEWIDLETPLGSASISQVHKAQLKLFTKEEIKSAGKIEKHPITDHVMRNGESSWDVCNYYGLSFSQLEKLNKGVNLENLKVGTMIRVPKMGDHHVADQGALARNEAVKAAILHAISSGDISKDGLVAVKIQYPDALKTMTLDLGNLRKAAYFLSRTELKFDLVSAVDELNKQIRLEFDFTREARVMNTIAHHLRDIRHKVEIPRSVAGLVTPRVLVMSFLEGKTLVNAQSRLSSLPSRKRNIAKRLILNRLSEAYGRMILGEGLFQADGHPGNILLSKGARLGLLDYGQSKQLSEERRLAFARLILAIARGHVKDVNKSMTEIGIVATGDEEIIMRQAVGMFDTFGTVNPFDRGSPLKKSSITSFPEDMFFVLRVIQLLRGLSYGMGIVDFSSAEQWTPFAKEALRRFEQKNNGTSWFGLRRLFWSG